MDDKFISIAYKIVKNMFQVIRNADTTVVFTDTTGKIIQVWTNVSAKPEYVLNLKPGDQISFQDTVGQAIGQSIKQDMFVELIAEKKALNKIVSIHHIAEPVHNAYNSVVGSLAIFCPDLGDQIDSIRGIFKITLSALEGQLKALEFQTDYDRVYNQLLGTMETIPIGTIVTDHNMTIIHVNDATQKIFGEDIKNIVGKKVDAYLHTNGFFQKMLDQRITMLDEEMVFHMPDGDVTCEVIVSLVKGKENENIQGLVIKLKNSKYMWKFKKSKDDNKAHFYFEDIVGASPTIKEAIRLAKIAARSTSNVLILGESGTGKELFAQSIHNHSSRREGPFVAINCGAMPGGLVESELFGYEGGAFTGARKEGQPGKFEQANGGTLFLDEIGDMPINEQISLLRVLQNKEVVRVGGNRIIKINVRIIAATNRDIEKEVQENRFRKDLFYRLNVFSISIPPLNERKEDLIQLTELFIKKYNVMLNKEVTGIHPIARKALMYHNWSGNIRELENVIERAVNVTRKNELMIEDLPSSFQQFLTEETVVKSKSEEKLTTHQELEKIAILQELKKSRGNISKVAQMLGIGRRTLYRRLEAYEIDNYLYKRKE